MNILPHHQPKHFHSANCSKDEDDGQIPAKRKLLSVPLHQVGIILYSKDKKDILKFLNYFALIVSTQAKNTNVD